MNIEENQEQYLEEMTQFKRELINVLSAENVEKYREEYKGRYSPERFKEVFIEKAALHTMFKYLLIRMIEESMGRVKVKLNEEGLKKWGQMSKNFREDYILLMRFAEKDVIREPDMSRIFINTIYDSKLFRNNADTILAKYIPILSKYNFNTLNANITLTIVDKLYNPNQRDDIQRVGQPSPVIDFLLQQVGLL